MITDLPTAAELLSGSPYVGYTYSYPHKTSHRPLRPARALEEVWSAEDRSALLLYFHIPFCEMRCGFCNLFTTTGAQHDAVERYLNALRRQAETVVDKLGESRFVRMAIGGGTPTYLEPGQLQTLLSIASRTFGVNSAHVPTSVETSPKTATPERLAVLSEAGVERISIGVQTFDDTEVRALGRPQRHREVESALHSIREHGFRVLNIDLMYGGVGQSIASWLASIDRALEWRPEEMYLYPLYVRQLTGLATLTRQWDDERLDAYRYGRDRLLSAGFEQVSMRMFRRRRTAVAGDPVYRCQDDGMLGLGCGARSYARHLHYSWPYAVRRERIRRLIDDYTARSSEQFGVADYGVELHREDQLRRFILLSMLQADGLDLGEYHDRFDGDPREHLPALSDLEATALAHVRGNTLKLTPLGLERSDAIGPWLYSHRIKARMESFQWR